MKILDHREIRYLRDSNFKVMVDALSQYLINGVVTTECLQDALTLADQIHTREVLKRLAGEPHDN